MNVARLLRTPVTITRVTDTGPPDAFGDPTEQTTTETFRGWLWQQSAGDLDTANRDLAFEQLQLVLHASAAGHVRAGDRATIDGTTYEIEGHPWNATHPATGHVQYVSAALRRT